MTPVALSVVIPAYNEAVRIAETVHQIAAYVNARELFAEILVVDDGSRDDTAKEAERATHGESLLRVIRVGRNRGKGFAIKTGMLEATGQCVLFTDVDLSVPLYEFDRFRPALEAGADVVIGSRRLGGSPLRRWLPRRLGVGYQSRIKVHQPFHRELLGEAYQKLSTSFLGIGVRDANCGFKAFRAAAAQRVFPRLTIERWGFDAELLLIARRQRLLVEELEVEWHNDPSSRVNLWSAPFSSLAEIFRIKTNDLRRRYS